MNQQEPDNVDLAMSTLATAVAGLYVAKAHGKPLQAHIHLVESALHMVKEADAGQGQVASIRHARGTAPNGDPLAVHLALSLVELGP
jgi:anti-sigma-K factor RskA